MNQTELIYLDNMQLYQSEAEVIEIKEVEGKVTVILNRTIFYPQGGGQPYDTGKIIGANSEFLVREVRNVEGIVYHYGDFSGSEFLLGEKVKLEVDQARRQLNSRLHTAGHVVDSALVKMGLKWSDSRGHHFPDGPYVSYENLQSVTENLKEQIEVEANNLIAEGYDIQSIYLQSSELSQHCFPGNMNFPEGKKLRVIKVYGQLGCTCGGTHVANIRDVGQIKIPKLKKEKQWTRIRYDLVM